MSKILSYVAVILWMVLIFFFSSQPAADSKELSLGVTEMFLSIVEMAAPDSDLFMENSHHFVRKNAHFFIYFLLGILVVRALRLSKFWNKKDIGLAFLICGIYAISDELHQLFVPGRGAQVKDVWIDSAGALVGILLYSWLIGLRNKRKA
ncbi:VanZ family protein [Psychrobacillus sp. FSL K6-2843]|uniref:VanZ family protein n=1 Tax=Psychrobacillus sp. FSL K6-2843 TaxID=2921549 RepID=UPI00315A010D